MRKADGTEYKEGVAKLFWNTIAKSIQETYYDKYQVEINPFTDIAFKQARDARNSKRRILRQFPEKCPQSSVELTQNECLKITNLLDEEAPVGLQRKLYYILSLELAWRKGEAERCRISYFHTEVDHKGNETGRIAYKPTVEENAQGCSKKSVQTKWLAINTDYPSLCPVR